MPDGLQAEASSQVPLMMVAPFDGSKTDVLGGDAGWMVIVTGSAVAEPPELVNTARSWAPLWERGTIAMV